MALSVAQNTQHWVVGLVNNELEGLWKEVVVA
jgi:hypothetical protein